MVSDIPGIQNCSSKSLKLNKAINTFMHLDKLTMSKKKYNNIHIGKQNMSCKGLTIDGSKMADSKHEDTIDNSGSIRPNIEKKKSPKDMALPAQS